MILKAYPKSIPALARLVLAEARQANMMIATAESCTGGLVAAALTAISGSSDVVDRGFVTYSNAAKTAMLGVPENLIANVGAVSAEVASAMAEGALRASQAGLAIAITGIAGPGGGSADKPVGLVHFAATSRIGAVQQLERRYSSSLSRAAIRRAATQDSLILLLEMMWRENHGFA